jgi:preprotein translocase subunit SecD
LTVAHAAVSAHRGPDGDVVVDFVLDPPDAAAFDRVAADNYQRQVALVMFGQVQSAPTINALQFNGRGQISGMSLEQAANAKAALAG